MIRAINRYTLLKEKKSGRIGNITAFRLDLQPRAVVVLVKFRGQSNPVSFTGLDNILDSFEIVREVNGKVRSVENDRLDVLTSADDLEGSRFEEMARTVEGE